MRLILSALILLCLIGCSTIDRPVLLQKEGFIFSKLKDESKLVGYFLTSQQKDDFKNLTDEAKWQFISEYWKNQRYNFAIKPSCVFINVSGESNEFHQGIVERIEYANKHFSNFKDGWETDMGKVYIKYGEPFEILELTNYGEPYEIFEPQNSGHYVKLAERQYYIWKYRTSHFRTFLFIEPQQHGDLRLIYSDGEEQYGSWREWKDYLGTNFDATLLH